MVILKPPETRLDIFVLFQVVGGQTDTVAANRSTLIEIHRTDRPFVTFLRMLHLTTWNYVEWNQACRMFHNYLLKFPRRGAQKAGSAASERGVVKLATLPRMFLAVTFQSTGRRRRDRDMRSRDVIRAVGR
jgi:hypothetical protein